VRRFPERCRVGLGGQQRQTAINLKSIRADNFRVAPRRDIGRELGFTARGWSDDEEGFQANAAARLLIQTRNQGGVASQKIGRPAPCGYRSPGFDDFDVIRASGYRISHHSPPACDPGIPYRAIPRPRVSLLRSIASGRRRTLSSVRCVCRLRPLRFAPGPRR
jgi:hypothetical protein